MEKGTLRRHTGKPPAARPRHAGSRPQLERHSQFRTHPHGGGPQGCEKPGALVIRSSAASLGPAAGLFPYHNHFWSELDPATFKPRFFHAVETDKKESVTTTTRHFPDRVECTEITKALKKGADVRKDRVFQFAPVFDIFSPPCCTSAARNSTMAIISRWSSTLDNPYLLRVRVAGRENHLGRKAIRLKRGHAQDRPANRSNSCPTRK